jgi:translation initiation factor IF-2
MSIRIHKLAEELGLDNKEMMALLKERRIIGQDVKSVSSTVDKISAAALREEFAARQPAPAAAAATPVEPAAPAAETPAADAGPPRVNLPSGVFVKSRQDIEREREVAAAAKAAALKAASAPPPPPPPPPPVAPAPVVPP